MTDEAVGPCGCTPECTSEKRLSAKQIRHLVNSMRKAGYIIWAALLDRNYGDDPRRWNHMWNTLPKEYHPWFWRWRKV